MAYVNVAEWKPDQVTDWLKGLDNCILPYIQSFLNNQITGQQLLSFGTNDLENLGLHKIGHQEIILDGIEHLRNIHYELDRENLQLLGMKLSCLAHSLHNELCHSHVDTQRLSTQILADIANIMLAVKPLIAWLDRPGFSGEHVYMVTRSEVLSLALRMATCGQRDRFVEAPVSDMKDSSAKLAKEADKIVQGMTDPLILQPASLDLATLKKRSSDELGFYIVPSFKGIHQISDLKLNSAAHVCGKIEPGDEIVQINYQTVVGWEVKHVMDLFAESPTEVLLTLKKRPRHTKVYGQIYVKPYRLPSKKRASNSHAYTPRPELLTRIQFRLPLHLKFPTPEVTPDETKRDSRGSTSSDEEVTIQHNLVVPSKPVHRRATITGVSPLSKRPPLDIHELWHDLKLEKQSALKQSTTSVIDFEERLSSTDNTKHNLSTSDINISSKIEELPKPLSIKERIELFSREDRNEKLKVSSKPFIKPSVKPVISDSESSNIISVRSIVKEANQNIALAKIQNTVHFETPSKLNVTDVTVVKPVIKDINIHKVLPESVKEIITSKEEPLDIENQDENSQTVKGPTFSKVIAPSRSELPCKPDVHCLEEEPPKPELPLRHDKLPKPEPPKRLEPSQIIRLEHQEFSKMPESISKPHNKESRKLEFSNQPGLAHRLSLELEAKPELPLRHDQIAKPEPPQRHEQLPKPDIPPKHDLPSKPELLRTLDPLFKPETGHKPYQIELPYSPEQHFCEQKSLLWSNPPPISISKPHTAHNLLPTEEHGKVVETINRHLLDRFHDDCDVIENPYADCSVGVKTFEALSNTLPLQGRQRKGIKLDDEKDIQSHSLPLPHHRSKECDPDLSRTISRVYTEDCYMLKEPVSSHFQYTPSVHSYHTEPVKQCKIKYKHEKSFSNECVPTHLMEHYGYSDRPQFHSDDDKEVYSYNSLQERHLRGERRDCHSETSSSKSYTSGDYTEQGFPLERQTLPKAVLPKTQDHERKVFNKDNPPVPPPRPSLSKPPNACYRAIMAARSSIGKASPKTHRKKHPILAKGRNVAVKDFLTPECEGWLSQRCRRGTTTWNKRWCLIQSNSFYTFLNKQGKKAETMVCLSGFTVCKANEVKSRQFAFKVYHTGTVFYFATESDYELTFWLDALNAATSGPHAHSEEIIFSESEGEDESRNQRKLPIPPTPAPRVPNQPSKDLAEKKKFGSLKKSSNRGGSTGSTNSSGSGGSSLDRKCLRILGTGPVPVPTAQYRSYRKVNTFSNSGCGTNGIADNTQQLPPPDMADYRMASLPAKSTPPVPRRRILRHPNQRPHISAPVLNTDQAQDLEHQLRRPVPQPPEPSSQTFRDGSSDVFWIDSLRKPKFSKKKSKKPPPQPPTPPTEYGVNRLFVPHSRSSEGSHLTNHLDVSNANDRPPEYPGSEYPPAFSFRQYQPEEPTLPFRFNRNRPS